MYDSYMPAAPSHGTHGSDYDYPSTLGARPRSVVEGDVRFMQKQVQPASRSMTTPYYGGGNDMLETDIRRPAARSTPSYDSRYSTVDGRQTQKTHILKSVTLFSVQHSMFARRLLLYINRLFSFLQRVDSSQEYHIDPLSRRFFTTSRGMSMHAMTRKLVLFYQRRHGISRDSVSCPPLLRPQRLTTTHIAMMAMEAFPLSSLLP